jgi:hypothetical protein
MKIVDIDHGDWTERRFLPDPPSSNGKDKDHVEESKPKIDITAWPVLDEAAYYGLAGEVVNTLLPNTEGPKPALLLQYLASAGNAIGRKPYYRLASVNHYPNLFVIIAGRTARSRKGTSAQDIRLVMESADPGWVRDNVKSGISSGEGIIHKVRDPQFEWDKKTQTLVCVDPGITDKRMLLDEREFSSTIGKMKQETNIVSEVLRKAWDCYPPVLQTMPKHKPSVATEPLISMVAHITIDELRQRLDKLSITDGFGNRFLYACVDRSKLLAHGGNHDPDVIDALGTKTREAIAAAQAMDRLTMSSDAAALWEKIYNDTENIELTSGLIDHITARAAPQTIRLAMLYALLDGSAQITVPHLSAARALWRFCETSAHYIFENLSSDRIADTILRELKDARPDGMNQRDLLHDVFGRNVHAHEIKQALRKLEAAGKVRRVQKTRGGVGRLGAIWFAI